MTRLPLSDLEARAWHAGTLSVVRRRAPGIDEKFFIRERRSQDGLYLFTFMGPDAENPNGTTGIYIDRWKRAPYRPGQVVFIGESFHLCDKGGWIYKADGATCRFCGEPVSRWKPPVRMPEWASRSKARIVSVQPEQDDGWWWAIRVER